MKAQFKYAFITGLYIRGITFAVIFIMDTVFITLGTLGLLPIPALITAVSLGGVAIAAMVTVNIASDVIIARRMFAPVEAYLYLLTPVPRRKMLFAGVITMLVMDFVTTVFVITSEVWMSFNLTGLKEMVGHIVLAFRSNPSAVLCVISAALLITAGYLLVIMIILFCVTAKKSIFYKTPASGLLAFLLACACFYCVSLLLLVLAPFGSVQRYGIFIIITLGGSALPFFILLLLLEAAGLFIVTSKLMERRMNI